uniref:TSA: Wollemia nobilis Ref_Wollemi_Transcript_13006_3501 transcribed RNA sequence n=1 Tax=Wollemia nobilis TaxID=56998 RepID=A0A0C9QR94_9CONI
MSGAVRSGAAVSIPASVRKTIQNLKEIAGNHSDEEIYAMLKECNMDPNETAQKLLYQDPFHEVKRKRDKRKDNASSKESVDVRSRLGSQGRGGRGGRGNYPSRYSSYDVGGGRGSNMTRENGGYQNANRASSNSAILSTTSQNVQTKTNILGISSLQTSATGAPVIPNGNSANICASPVQVQGGSWSAATGNNTMADVLKSTSVQQVQTSAPSAPATMSVTEQGQPLPSSQQHITSVVSTSVSGVYSSSSDPVLVPSLDTRVSGGVGTIKREVGAQRINVEQTTGLHENKPAVSNFSSSLQKTQSNSSDAADSEGKVSTNENSATIHSFSHDRVSQSQTVDGDHRLSDIQPQASSSTSTASSVGRSSVIASHYNIRPQQLLGSQKAVGPNKEWKPKATSQNAVANSGIIGTSTVSTSTSDASRSPSPASNSVVLEDAAAKLQKNLEELNVRDDQHVIMPNHLQVPDVERTGLSFGSFDASFDVNFGANFARNYGNDDESEKSSSPSSEESQVAEEAAEEPAPSTNTASATPHEDYAHHQAVSATVDNLPSTNDVPVSVNSTVPSQSDQSKAEVVVQASPQYSLVQTAPSYSSLVPQIVGSQYQSYEHAEPQLRDSQFQSVVQQAPYDPSTSYYTPIIRPSSDGDARFSPFFGSAAGSKYNGNLTMLSGQNVPLSQESGNSLVLSNAGPTALATQTGGIVQTIPLPQQPVPVFRQPASVHLSHYPPNYLPYHQYFSPFYVPSPTMHNFVGNSGFSQLPAGSSYPQAVSSYPPAAAGVKYSLPSQYKPGTATGNSPHIGVPAGYGSYTTAPSGYSASPAVTAGNASGCDEIGGSQYKENNMYVAGQQGEGSTVWLHQGPPRDILSMQANSYYNMPPQGQHVTFAHTQGGHAAYAGLYHPTQSGPATNAHPLLQQTQALGGAVGVVGAQAGVYQQPQRAQLNWANNY